MSPAPPTRISRSDLVAGISVGLVMIPQSMAYAELAGLPAQHGLYAAAFAPIAAAPFASSPYLQTGPGALTCLLTLGALLPLAPLGSTRYVTLAALLAVVVGLLRAVVGLVKAGGIAYILSRPVMGGFATGAGVLIVSTQVPGALGIEAETGGTLISAWDAITHPSTWHVGAMALTAATIALVLGGRTVNRRFPWVIVAALLGLGATLFLGYSGETVGSIPPGLPSPEFDLDWSRLPRLFIPGAVIALVGFAEVASIAHTYATKHRQDWEPNQEFVGQGAANLAAGLVGGLPVGGSFSRSGLAHLAGGKTRWTGAFAGLTVLLFLPVAGALSGLPRAVLAGIVIASVVSLIRIRPILRLFRFARLQGIIAVTTLVLTLALAPHIEYAVIAGVLLALVIHYWRESQVRVISEQRGTTVILRPSGVLWFGSAPSLERALTEAISRADSVERVVVDLAGVGRVDYSGAATLSQVRDEVLSSGLSWGVAHVPSHAKRVLEGVMGPL